MRSGTRKIENIGRFKRLLLKNAMLITIGLTSLINASALFIWTYRLHLEPDSQFWLYRIDSYGLSHLTVIFLSWLLIYLYERPYRRYFNLKADKRPVNEKLEITAKRRLLNEPFFVAKLYGTFWLIGATFYVMIARTFGISWFNIRLNIADTLYASVTGISLAMGVMILILQRFINPYIFPEGRLTTVPGAKIVGIRQRMIVLFLLCNIMPLFAIVRAQIRISSSGAPADELFYQLSQAIWIITPFSITAGLLFTIFVVSNTTYSINSMLAVLKEVARGNYEPKVEVVSGDEIGYAGDVINDMTAGLKERERMKQSLILAMEVQQNLLPQKPPIIDGFDIDGKCIFCDETGGDYFDYLVSKNGRHRGFCVIVGDVSDHGLPAALLMASVRAYLRNSYNRSEHLAEIITGVNRQVCLDVEDTGRFITLFALEINPERQMLNWVRAGHEPALIYDVNVDEFTELTGKGVPLGLLEDIAYEDFSFSFRKDQILLIGTDGIWEETSWNGVQYGKERFRESIRRNAGLSASDMLDALLSDVAAFTGHSDNRDDQTLVIIKIVS